MILGGIIDGDSNRAMKKCMIMEGHTSLAGPILSFSLQDLEGVTSPIMMLQLLELQKSTLMWLEFLLIRKVLSMFFFVQLCSGWG